MIILGYLITCISEIITFHYFVQAYLSKNNKISMSCIIGLHLIYACVTISQVYFVYAQGLNTLLNLLMKMLLMFCYIGTAHIKFLMCTIILIIGVLGECAVLVGGKLITNTNLSDPDIIMSYMPILCLLSSIVRFFLTDGVIKLTKFYQKHKKHWYIANLLLISSLIMMSAVLLVNFGKSEYLIYSLLIILVLIVAIATCLDMFKDQLQAQHDALKSEFLEQQLYAQLNHYESLYKQMYRVHEIRHNAKNILITIDSYLSLGEIDNSREYINRYQTEISASNVVDSGVPLLDAVLTAKKSSFKGDFQLHMVPLSCNNVDLADIGMMLAIALDNAVEGTKGIEQPYIMVSIVQQSLMISIQIKNPTLNQPSSTYQFPPSTKADAIHHGYGLKSCSRISKKWNGDMSWECSDGVFTLDIFVQDIPAIKE